MYIDDLRTARDALAAALAAGPVRAGVGSGVVKYSLDGESYDVDYDKLVGAIEKLDDLIVKTANRTPGRSDLRLVRGRGGRWWP
jgi:hypothetical protein